MSDGNGAITSSEEEIREIFANFFEHFWALDRAGGSIPVALPGPSLPFEARRSLIRPVEDEEITQALRSSPLGKAPGVDGLGASFYRSYWDIVKTELAVNSFFQGSFMPPSWKKTLIALIPKKTDPLRVSDYRPISLCTFPFAPKYLLTGSRKYFLILFIESREPLFYPG